MKTTDYLLIVVIVCCLVGVVLTFVFEPRSVDCSGCKLYCELSSSIKKEKFTNFMYRFEIKGDSVKITAIWEGAYNNTSEIIIPLYAVKPLAEEIMSASDNDMKRIDSYFHAWEGKSK